MMGHVFHTEVKNGVGDKKEKIIWLVSAALLVVTTIVLYVTHSETPFMMDDLWYSTLLYEDTPISSLRDIIDSQIWHYNNWGGRSIAHGILQLTLLAGERAADIINLLMTFLLAGMICTVAGNRRLPVFFAAMALPLGLNANWRMSMFWQAGAANYLYMTVFILAYVYCYLRELPEEDGGPNAEDKGERTQLPGIVFWVIPLGIAAGWSNENMGPSVWILSLLVIFWTARNRRKVRLWMVLGNIACLFGSVMVILAPGNFLRSGQVGDSQYGILWRLFLRNYSQCRAALVYLFPTVLILLVVIVLMKSINGLSLGRRNVLLLFCALLSWGAMFLSPHYPDRAAFGTMVLLICVILSVFGKILDRRKDLAWPVWFVTFFVWLRGMYFCCEQLGYNWGWIR